MHDGEIWRLDRVEDFLFSRRFGAQCYGCEKGNQYRRSGNQHVLLNDKGETPNAQRRTQTQRLTPAYKTPTMASRFRDSSYAEIFGGHRPPLQRLKEAYYL
jgi:hypothetical protein